MQLTKEMCERKITISIGEARRLICQGAVKVNGEKVDDMLREVNKEDVITIGKVLKD